MNPPRKKAAATQIHELLVPEGVAAGRVDAMLARLLPQYSRARLQRWIDAGQVQLDGVVPGRSDTVKPGQRLRVEAEFPADESVQAGAAAVPFRVLHRDAAILIIDKPAGLVVHPGAGVVSGTMQNGLLALDPQLSRVPRAGIVHRLDKDTSGLLVVARTPAAHAALVRALAAREVGREYLALCHGVMTGGGTVDEPIGRHRTQRTRMAVRGDGREAVTHYRIERRFRAHTLARVQLETGRTHQIRVHLAHIGHPIVGDPLYGGRRRQPAAASAALLAALTGFKRQALHAARLTLSHPVSGRELEFESPLPKDFKALLATLEAAEGGR
ncbi:MAG: 23S rRNA pseudouridine(1911/1915/1917) synthase RluD [Gammaproteobacteria bacterium]|nr:23S rRNA pseudouridine(1911/1915/1917) synthase RluD [Gammaproteobacteria bacterium]